MASSLIRGRHLVRRVTGPDTADVLDDGALLQRDGVIVEVGAYAELRAKHPGEPEVGSRHHLVLPAFVNAHHHAGLSAGLTGCLDGTLELWLHEMWARRDADPYLDALYSALHLMRSGVGTTIVNLTRWIPPAGDAVLRDAEQVIRGYRDAGMRVAFSIAFKERNRIVYGEDEAFARSLPGPLRQLLEARLGAASLSGAAYLQLFETLWRGQGGHRDDRVRLLLSPSNVLWVSDQTLVAIKDLAGRCRTGIHLHLAETKWQQDWGPKTVGKTPTAHLHDLGVLGPEVSCAHCVWLTDEDMDLLAAAGATVSHNPSSNLRLGSGIARVHRMLERGVNVGIGVDSTGINDDHDMLQELRLVSVLHRGPGWERPRLGAPRILRMATENGARACLLADRVGTLEVGKRADAVLIDLERLADPRDASVEVPVLDLFLLRAKPEHVDTVVLDGQIVVAEGRCTTIDEKQVMTELRGRLALPLKPHEAERKRLAQALSPHIRAFYKGWPSRD